MNLTPPKTITFWIAIVIAILALLSQLGTFSIIPIAAFWLLFIGFVLLALAVLVKNL